MRRNLLSLLSFPPTRGGTTRPRLFSPPPLQVWIGRKHSSPLSPPFFPPVGRWEKKGAFHAGLFFPLPFSSLRTPPPSVEGGTKRPFSPFWNCFIFFPSLSGCPREGASLPFFPSPPFSFPSSFWAGQPGTRRLSNTCLIDLSPLFEHRTESRVPWTSLLSPRPFFFLCRWVGSDRASLPRSFFSPVRFVALFPPPPFPFSFPPPFEIEQQLWTILPFL